MKLSLQSEEDGIVRLHSEGEIRLGDQLRERSSVEDILGPDCYGRKILLDLKNTSYIDSAGVGWLVRFHKLCQQFGGVLVLHSLPPAIMAILRLLHMERFLHIVDDERAPARWRRERPHERSEAAPEPRRPQRVWDGPRGGGRRADRPRGEAAGQRPVHRRQREPRRGLGAAPGDRPPADDPLARPGPAVHQLHQGDGRHGPGRDAAAARRPLGPAGGGRQPRRPADQHDPHPLRRGHDAPPAGLPVAGAGARLAGHEHAEPQRPAVDAQLPQRPDPGHRPDRLGQDHDALRRPAPPERRPAEDQHDRGPDRVRGRRPAAVAGQPQGRRRLPRAAAEHPPADPRRDHDRRDPRPGDRRDRRARRQQRPARAGDACTPRSPPAPCSRCSAWAPIPTSSPTRSWA